MADEMSAEKAAMKPLDYCPICRDRLRAPDNECPRHGDVTVLEDGCIGGHSPSLVNCVLGSDWP